MDEPQGLLREIRSVLPIIPIMVIAGLVVVVLTNGGPVDASKRTFLSVIETASATSTATITSSPTATPTASSTATPTPTATSTAIVYGVVSRSESCPNNSSQLPNALVQATSDQYITSYWTVSDGNGAYTLTVPAPAVAMISVSAIGYVTQTNGPLNLSPGLWQFSPCLNFVPSPTSTPTASLTPTATGTPTTPTSTPTATSSATATETTTSTTTPTATTTTVPGSQRGVVSATTGGTVSTADGRVTVIVPAGAVDENFVVVIIPRSLSDLTVAPTPFRMGSSIFSVEAYLNGATLTTFQRPITVRTKYSAADVIAAAGDANRLGLAYYSSTSRVWLATGSRTWPADSVVEALVTQPATFGIVIGQSAIAMATTVPVSPRQLPRTGDNVDWTMALFLAGMVSVIAGMVVRQLAVTERR